MREREHTGFVTQNATDQPPGLGEIWNCIQKGHKSVENVKQSKVCRVAGVKSDGMFTHGI